MSDYDLLEYYDDKHEVALYKAVQDEKDASMKASYNEGLWRFKDKRAKRSLVRLFNNIYESHGETPTWDEFKTLADEVSER